MLLLSLQGWSQSFKFQHFGENDGINTLFVYSIEQEQNGYLLVGTDRGLFRFDGFRFVHYGSEKQLAQRFIRCSEVSPDGSIWYGHDRGALTTYRDGVFSPLDISGTTGSRINDISFDQNGEVWVLSQADGVVQIKNSGELITHSKGLEDFTHHSMAFVGEKLLVGSDFGLFIGSKNENGEYIFDFHEDILETHVSDIQPFGDKFLIATQDEGLFFASADGSEIKVERVEVDGADTKRWSINQINCDSKSVHVATNNAGLFELSMLQGNRFEKLVDYNEGGLIGTKSIQTTFLDRENNLWIGTIGKGLVKLEDDYFSYYTMEGLEDISSLAIHNDSIWFTSGSGLHKAFGSPANVVHTFDESFGIPEDKCTKVAFDSAGNLFLGTRNSGLYRRFAGEDHFERINLSAGHLSNRINDILSKGNVLWVATDGGIFQLKDGEIIANITMQSGLPHNVVRDLYQDRSGKVWVVTLDKDLCSIDKLIKQEAMVEIPGRKAPTCYATDLDGNLWIGTDGTGVFKVSATDTVHYDMHNGLGSDYCYSLICDDNNRLWVGHRGFLSRIDVNQTKVDVFNGSDEHGFEFMSNSAYQDDDGLLWFGTSTGILRYDQEQDIINEIEPALNITGLTISDSTYALQDQINLPYGNYKLEVDFVGISFRKPDQVKYEYFLEGHDPNWSEMTTEKRVLYNRLESGSYAFHVRAYNSNSKGGTLEQVFRINVDKPFWGKWWFITICGFVLFMTVRFIVVRRERVMKKTQEYLQKELDERTKEVVEQKELLEIKNKDITDSIVYAKNIQKAMLPPPDALPNIFNQSFVFFKPRDIVSGDFYWVEEFEDNVILACADCTGHGVPGAFMSLIGSALLKEVARKSTVGAPNIALQFLDEELRDLLNREGSKFGVEDGMDISIVEFNRKTGKFRGASARRPIIIYHQGVRHVLKGDRFSIGGTKEGDHDKMFTLHEMSLETGDAIYQFSDGFADQFGGNRGKKLKKNGLLSILDELCHLDMAHQGRLIRQRFYEWKGNLDQVDDVIMVGVRV